MEAENCEEAHVCGCFGDGFERVFVFVKEYLVLLLDC